MAQEIPRFFYAGFYCASRISASRSVLMSTEAFRGYCHSFCSAKLLLCCFQLLLLSRLLVHTLTIFVFLVPFLGVHSFFTYARRGKGSNKSVYDTFKGEWVDTTNYVRNEALFLMYFVMFSYAKYFCHTFLSLVMTFIAAL